MPGELFTIETPPTYSPFAGVVANLPAAAPFGGGVLLAAQRVVYGRVCWFEETTDRDHNRTLDFEQRMTRTFQVLTSHPLVGSTTVVAFDQLETPFEDPDPGAAFNGNPNRKVPEPGDKYVELNDLWEVVHENPHVVCVDVQARQQDPDNLQNWTVTANYAGVADPLAQPHEVDWETVPYQEALLKEVEVKVPFADPRDILNSAKDPFAEGVLADGDRHQLTIVKNVIGYDPVAIDEYQNSVNSTTYLALRHPPGFDAGTCKVKFKARRVRRSGNSDFYWRVTAVVEIDKRGWDARVRDAGFNYLPAGDVTKKQPVAMHARFVGRPAPSTPQLLKTNGDLADPADPVPAPLEFRKHKRKDWTPLAAVLNYTG